MLYDDKKFDQELPPADLDEVGMVLWNAARFIETHKWCQEALTKPGGAVCALGAINKVVYGIADMDKMPDYKYNKIPPQQFGLDEKAENRALKYLKINTDYISVSGFNDSEDRKKSEVVEMLKTAAKFK